MAESKDNPAFPAEALALDDYELGGFLLGWYMLATAIHNGHEELTEEYAEHVRQSVPSLEAERAGNIAVEKALHKAATGDFERAGALIREHLTQGAIAKRFIPIGISKSRQASEFGRRGADLSRKQGEKNEEMVLQCVNEIKKNGHTSHIVKLVSQQLDMPVNTVKGVITRLRKKGRMGRFG